LDGVTSGEPVKNDTGTTELLVVNAVDPALVGSGNFLDLEVLARINDTVPGIVIRVVALVNGLL